MLRFCFLFICSLTFGQVKQTKTWNASEIKSITLDFPWASIISVSSHKYPIIEVNYQKEGEYQSIFLLRGEIQKSSFYLQEYKSLNLIEHLDKLSVHKVIANKIEIKIPLGLNLNMNIKDAQLNCSGVFESLNVVIEEGKAIFNIVDIKGKIKSLSADLYFYGLKSQTLPKKLNASSIRGNIVVHPN